MSDATVTRLPPEQLPPGHKYDAGKPRLELLPGFEALMEVGKVATFGARKYADHNWRKSPTTHRYQGALLRHTFQYLAGETNDPETGLPHLAHAAWNALALLQMHIDGVATDDRFIPPARKEAASNG